MAKNRSTTRYDVTFSAALCEDEYAAPAFKGTLTTQVYALSTDVAIAVATRRLMVVSGRAYRIEIDDVKVVPCA